MEKIKSEFNLIYEPWVKVLTNDNKNIEVSLKTLFENAHQYIGLAGDMKTQDFAILRILQAILNTVFSRFDATGKKYPFLELDSRYIPQTKKLNNVDTSKYIKSLIKTWDDLWEMKKFPSIINDYLEKQKDRFYLFDEKHPFMQANIEILKKPVNQKGKSYIYFKDINRLISESGNTKEIFSPKEENYKNKLSHSELARWILMLHGYTGTDDKCKFKEMEPEEKSSIGTLLPLGGIALKGNNLFETLLLNLILVHPDQDYQTYSSLLQTPSWEYDNNELIEKFITSAPPKNLSELYTWWSRAFIYDNENKEALQIIKLPEITNINLEPQTLWTINKKENKIIPKLYEINESLWKSFGLIIQNKDKTQKQPHIIKWYQYKEKIKKDYNLTIVAVGMKKHHKGASQRPVNEIYDTLTINDFVIKDLKEKGWNDRIEETVRKTKEVIEKNYKKFVKSLFIDIRAGGSRKAPNEINYNDRKKGKKSIIDSEIEKIYSLIDYKFKYWLSSIKPSDKKDDKTDEWKNQLKLLLEKQAKKLVIRFSRRDVMGSVSNVTNTENEELKKYQNIFIVYNDFMQRLYKFLNPRKRVNYEKQK